MARRQATATSWALKVKPNCQRSGNRPVGSKEHWVGLEPTSPHYESGILAAGRPVPVEARALRNESTRDSICILEPRISLLAPAQVGPEGLEPSPIWLRARHAAANTLDPCIGPSPETKATDVFYACNPQLNSAACILPMRPEGFEPPPC